MTNEQILEAQRNRQHAGTNHRIVTKCGERAVEYENVFGYTVYTMASDLVETEQDRYQARRAAILDADIGEDDKGLMLADLNEKRIIFIGRLASDEQEFEWEYDSLENKPGMAEAQPSIQ